MLYLCFLRLARRFDYIRYDKSKGSINESIEALDREVRCCRVLPRGARCNYAFILIEDIIFCNVCRQCACSPQYNTARAQAFK